MSGPDPTGSQGPADVPGLRRAGDPFTLPQSVLMNRLGLTSGTVSVRLERKGAVTSVPSSDDGRGVMVTLTARGVELFDRVAPGHLDSEDVLLSALEPHERDQLAGLLRKLLVAFEHARSSSPLGFTVEPAHAARRARRAVGLSDRPGLLVHRVESGTPAGDAGLQTGDLVLTAGGRAALSCTTLADATRAAHASGGPPRLVVLRGEQEHIIDVHPRTGR